MAAPQLSPVAAVCCRRWEREAGRERRGRIRRDERPVERGEEGKEEWERVRSEREKGGGGVKKWVVFLRAGELRGPHANIPLFLHAGELRGCHAPN